MTKLMPRVASSDMGNSWKFGDIAFERADMGRDFTYDTSWSSPSEAAISTRGTVICHLVISYNSRRTPVFGNLSHSCPMKLVEIKPKVSLPPPPIQPEVKNYLYSTFLCT